MSEYSGVLSRRLVTLSSAAWESAQRPLCRGNLLGSVGEAGAGRRPGAEGSPGAGGRRVAAEGVLGRRGPWQLTERGAGECWEAAPEWMKSCAYLGYTCSSLPAVPHLSTSTDQNT